MSAADERDVERDAIVAADRAPLEPGRTPITLSDVVATWRAEGALDRVPTGFAKLDEAMRGGVIPGRRIYLTGAPGAGKTALAEVLARRFLDRGLVVGILAVDEEAEDRGVRWAQMVAGVSQADCERRDPATLDVLDAKLAPLMVRMYGPKWSVEEAAEHLAAYAKREGKRAVFVVDSLQTAHSTAERLAEVAGRPMQPMQAVDSRVRAIRTVTTGCRFVTLVISEMNRSSYKSKDAAANGVDMASSKGSGSVEYSAQTLLTVRSVKGHPDLVHMMIAKNRGGIAGGEVWLALDRQRHELTETEAPPADEKDASDAGKNGTKKLADLASAVRLAVLESTEPIKGGKAMRATLRERGVKFGNDDLDAVLIRLRPNLANEGTEHRPKWRWQDAAP